MIVSPLRLLLVAYHLKWSNTCQSTVYLSMVRYDCKRTRIEIASGERKLKKTGSQKQICFAPSGSSVNTSLVLTISYHRNHQTFFSHQSFNGQHALRFSQVCISIQWETSKVFPYNLSPQSFDSPLQLYSSMFKRWDSYWQALELWNQ